MKRFVLFMAMMAASMVLAPICEGSEIVVLTETPVAEFTLPDGTVLKNAFAWRRTSEGIMIVYDDGQYYLNFKTLPADWRQAYEVKDEIGTAPQIAEKRYDQYTMYPILERIEGLSNRAVGFFESEHYRGEYDETLFSACIMQSLLDGVVPKAQRLHQIQLQRFPDSRPAKFQEFFETCEKCKGTGTATSRCPSCKGSKKCGECDGAGMRKSLFQNEEPTHCTTCKGTGKCPKCLGNGILSFSCSGCRGQGKVLRSAAVKASLAELVEQLNAFQTERSKKEE